MNNIRYFYRMILKRKQYESLKAHIPQKEFTVLIGARQTGKSTLLRQLLKELLEEGEDVVFLNLERKDVLLSLNQGPENVFRFVPTTSHKRVIVLIDEIQYLNDPTNFLKLLFDEHADRLKIVATGSSAFYIDRQFKDSLVGRKRIFEMPTLDFEEFLFFKNQNVLLNDLKALRNGTIEKSVWEEMLWVALEEYITFGGYPAVVLAANTQEKIAYLQEIRDSFIKRDILEAGINDEIKFYRLMLLLASQIGNLLNTNEIANTLRISNATAEQYLYVLQKCFHVGLLRPFFQNLRKELIKMPKLYFNDLGLRNAMLNYFEPLEQRTDKRALLENYVYLRLSQQHKEQVKFWRTADGNEIDFVIEQVYGSGKAVEVKFSRTEAKPSKYKKFQEQYPNFPLSFKCWRDVELLF